METAHKPDYQLLIFTGILLVVGLIMITSIGVPKSIQLSAPNILYPSCDDPAVDCYLLFKKHVWRLVIGISMLFLVAKIHYRAWQKASTVLYVGAVFALVLVLILGSAFNTFAKSWITIFNTSIQPTEFAKIGLILYLAHWFDTRKSEISTFHNGFLPFCFITGLLLLPVLIQPDVGGAFVITVIASGIYFAAGASKRHFAVGVLAALMVSLVIGFSSTHIRQRVKAYVSNASECREDYCWQSEQSTIAVGSGGFFGKGLAQGVQKSYWLPQASDDFIFAASAEELGFVRTSILVILYLLIAYRGFVIARGAPNGFAMLTALGISLWIFVQAYINISVNIGIFPITGITLPFVSYGGSSLIALLIAVGILLNISKYSSYAAHVYRRRDGRAHTPQYRRS